MSDGSRAEQTAAVVALLRAGGRAWTRFVLKAREAGGAQAVDPHIVLDEELGLWAYDALAQAIEELTNWQRQGIRTVTLRDDDYPPNLAIVASRPPLLFIKGTLTPADNRSVSVIGTRDPSEAARTQARQVARLLAEHRFTVVSGLAAGIDTEAHRATLERHSRTVAVIGTGLHHAYPAENRDLQDRIGNDGAVVSQFWPDAGPSKRSFPARNAVMAGLTNASVIIEASQTSGTRIQARHALDQGRQVILMRAVMANDWARRLADQSGVSIADSAEDVIAAIRA